MSGPINWDFALEGVAGDEAFLAEVFCDLFQDSIRCTEVAEEGINEMDFKKIDSAAHEIKGSCLYLGCDALKDACFALEMVGKEGQQEGSNHNALIADAKVKFTIYKECLEAVRKEVKRKGYFRED